MPDSEMKKYKEYLTALLGKISPLLARYALGDFSESIEIPEKEDEFTELLVGLNLMVDDIRELLKAEADRTARLSTGVSKMIDAIQKVARGDYSVQIELSGENDELDSLAMGLNMMIDDIRNGINVIERERNYTNNIIMSMLDTLIIVDLDGKIKRVNPATTELLGYKEDELIGKPVDTIFEKERISLKGTKLERLIKEGRLESYELSYKARDGRKIPVLLSTTTIKDENGNISGALCVAKDITERKRTDEEEQRLEAQLQRAQKMEAIVTLAGGVAHDLNNILVGLVSYPELLLMEIPEDSPLRKPILTIQKSGERAAAIVQDLLTLARRGIVVAEVVNLNHIISEYEKSPEREKLKLYHFEVQLETNLETDLLNILGSPVHLSKTVMNLVVNAAEAMPDGGKIFISTENQYIDRPIRGYENVEEGDYVVLTVSDTGLGISLEDMERIFEPFYTKKAMGRSGTGLGMAVVWGTVKDHKGYIDVQSTQGKGTTMTLYFPVTRKEAAKDKFQLSIEDYMGKGESILIVDDVEEQREIASVMLKKLGYSVTLVSSGEKAVDYMENNSADLLVLDMIMDPGIDGLETYKRILELHPGQKAIIVSGFSETDRVKEAQRLGAGVYVKKPYLLEKIGLTVKSELEK